MWAVQHYADLIATMTDSDFPCPIGITQDQDTFLWAEDAGSMPPTIDQVINILVHVQLARACRLPV